MIASINKDNKSIVCIMFDNEAHITKSIPKFVALIKERRIFLDIIIYSEKQ